MPDSSDQIASVQIPVRASSIAISVVLVLTAIFYYITQDFSQTIVFFAASVAAAGGVLSAFFAAKALDSTAEQLVHQAYENKQQAALSFVTRWNDPSMFELRDSLRVVMSHTPKSAELLAEARERETDVTHFLNFLEEIAIAIECGIADSQVLKDAFCGTITGSWHALEDLATELRTESRNKKLWIKLEDLFKQWH